MPFFIRYSDRDETQEISEGEAHRIVNGDFHSAENREFAWGRLMKRERVFVRLGCLTWEGIAGDTDGPS